MAQKLFDKASLVMIPSQYKEGKIYNIKPEDQSSSFEFERGSAATRVNSDGLIEFVDIGEELATATNWSNGPTYDTNTGTLTAINLTSNTSIDVNIENNETYLITYTIVSITSAGAGVRTLLGGSGGSQQPYRNQPGTYREVVTYPSGASIDKLYFSVNGTTSFEITDISLKQISNDTPRLDYSGTEPALLLEPQRTNELRYSSDLSIDKQEFGVSLVKDQTGLDGSSNGYTLTEDSNTSEHYIILDAMDTATNQQLTSSIFIKPNGRNKIQLWNYFLTNQFARVDIDLSTNTTSNGSASNMTFNNATVEDYPNGWKRVSITSTKPSSTYAYKIRVSLLDDNGNTSYQGNGTGGLILFGQQIELASYPTSYIPTNGQTETRNLDLSTNSNISDFLPSTGYTIFFEAKSPPAFTGSTQAPLNFTSSTTDRISPYFYNGTLVTDISANGVTRGGLVLESSATVNTVYKTAISVQNNNIRKSSNGSSASLLSSDLVTPVLSILRLGSFNSTSNALGSTLGQVVLFPEALTDTELQQLTSNT